jgi:hypothetical protein
MDPEELTRKLESWDHGGYVCFGAASMLLAMAILDIPIMHKSQVLDWYFAWFLFELTVAPLGFVILWTQLPLRIRMGTAYGFFASAWLALFAFGVQTGSDPRNWNGGLIGLMQIVTLIVLGTLTLICFTYWLLRRSEKEKPEEIFP